jgi:anti-sigma factor RsiW
MSRRDFTERDIHMALDGELPEEERADFDAWLDVNPEMRARSVRFEADRTRLRDTFAGVLEEPAPDRLTKLIVGEASRPAAHSCSRSGPAEVMSRALAALVLKRRPKTN